MIKKAGSRLLYLFAALMLLLAMAYSPASAAPPRYQAARPAAALLAAPLPDTGLTVAALPNRVINGDTITFYARCVNPSLAKVTGAGFYVGSDTEDLQKINCKKKVSELSEAASMLFEVEMKLPRYTEGYYKAFVLCGGEEITSEALPFHARPPLPPPVISVQSGARLTAQEVSIDWEAVDGAAYYGVTLRDISSGTGSALLLGQDSADAAEAYYWVDADTTRVQAGAWRSKLVSGHTYRLFVCSSYDKQAVFGKSVQFKVISRSTAANTAPVVETGLHYKNGDGTITLYGAVDCAGRPLSQAGFLVGKSVNDLKPRRVENPDEFTGGAYSLTLDVKNENDGTLYYRAFAVGKNGVEKRGELKKAVLENADPFAPVEKTAKIDESYVPRLAAIDKEWSFHFIKKLPYNFSNTEIQLLNDWEEQHILKGFPFPGKAISINIWAINQYKAAAASLNSTQVKLVYKDGSATSFLLKDLVKTAASYNSRYIYPVMTDENGNKLPPHLWNWRLSLHSWGASVDVNAAIRVNRQKGINFAAIRGGAVKLSCTQGSDSGGAVVLHYDGYPQQGQLVPDDVSSYILYELAFKKAGFYWGAYFGNNRTDPMHFSLIEVPARKDIPLWEAKELANE